MGKHSSQNFGSTLLRCRNTYVSHHNSHIANLSDNQSQSKAAAMADEKKKFERLSSDVTPINYKLKLQPDLKELTFVGSQDVIVKVNKAVKTIKMNANEVDVENAVYKGA